MDRGGKWICINAGSSVAAFIARGVGNFQRAIATSRAGLDGFNDWRASKLDGRFAVGCGGDNGSASASTQNHSKATREKYSRNATVNHWGDAKIYFCFGSEGSAGFKPRACSIAANNALSSGATLLA